MTDPAAAPPPGSERPHEAPSRAPVPWLLRRVNQRYRTTATDRLAAAGFDDLPQPGFWALTALAGGATDASRLTGVMGVSKQRVSKLVDDLVTAGFVERRVNAADRRRTDLLLSGKGRRAVAVIRAAVQAAEEDFVAELGAGRFADLVRTLAQLAGEELTGEPA